MADKKKAKPAVKNKGGPPKGSKFWLLRAKHGRDKIFKTPARLWKAACEYFTWVEDNPLKEEKLFNYKGFVTREDVNKMRAMTMDGLCLYLDISTGTWDNYRKRDNYLGVTSKIENVIRSQKFAGAAADMLNANIIARDLGLKDSTEVSGPGGSAIPVQVTFIGVGSKVGKQ